MMHGVTIIIPVFNQERFIKQAIESALAQTYPCCSIWVIDDGSTDNTPTILQKYGDRVKIARQQNAGTSVAWNHALKQIKDNFVVGLDSDDELTPNCVQEVMFALNQHPKADMVYSDYEFIDSVGNITKTISNPQPQDSIRQLIQLHDRLGQPNNFLPFGHVRLYRRQKLIDINGYDPQYLYAEDYDLVLRLAEKKAKFVHVPKVLYRYRWHDTNKGIVTRSGQVEDVKNSLKAFYSRNPHFKKGE